MTGARPAQRDQPQQPDRRRAREEGELARLGRRALAGVPVPELLEDAVSIVADTLGADMAAVLELLPGEEDLLLRAAHGFGDWVPGEAKASARGSYMGAVLASREPIISADLPADARYRVSPLILAMGAESAAAVVILIAGEPWGVLAALDHSRRRFSEDDAGFVAAVANTLALAIERRAAEDAARASEARLRLALRSGQLGAWEWDVPTGAVQWSEELAGVLRLPPDWFGGTVDAFVAMVHPEDRDAVATALEAALAGDAGYEVEFRFVRPDGSEGWIAAHGVVLRDDEGNPRRMVGLAGDITARREREETLAFLAEAGEALQATLDYERTLTEVARLAVPQLADCCIVDIVESGDEVHQLTVVHVDPDREALVRELERRYPADATSDRSFVGSVFRERRPRLVSPVDATFLASLAQDDEHLADLTKLGLSSVLGVPLFARGRTLGIITLLCDVSGRRLRPHDAALAEALARLAALAVDNARLYEQRSRVARTLQQSLLPPELPSVDWVELAARYRAVGAGIDIGGDFYDAFPVGGGFGIAIGDVCGKGVDAAAVTGLARHTIRASALHHESPGRSLGELNEVVLRAHEAGTYCTVAYAVLEPRARGARVALACGGHPLPLVLRKDGRVEAVGAYGTLIGIFPDPEFTEAVLELEEGEAIVLYTDGLAEGLGGGQLDGGERRLAALLGRCVGRSADEIAEAIEEAAATAGSAIERDDAALLVARVVPSGAAGG